METLAAISTQTDSLFDEFDEIIRSRFGRGFCCPEHIEDSLLLDSLSMERVFKRYEDQLYAGLGDDYDEVFYDHIAPEIIKKYRSERLDDLLHDLRH